MINHLAAVGEVLQKNSRDELLQRSLTPVAPRLVFFSFFLLKMHVLIIHLQINKPRTCNTCCQNEEEEEKHTHTQ